MRRVKDKNGSLIVNRFFCELIITL